jgi:hypothetical protein
LGGFENIKSQNLSNSKDNFGRFNLSHYYLCYLVGYEPRAEQETAHHMLLFGCEEPGIKESIFRNFDFRNI